MRGDAGFPVRVRFTKHGKVRFVSHRDVARAFERALRIERLPLAFTQGFSPRPKVSFGLALGVGHESRAEYLDAELAEPVALDGLADRLADWLPEGIDVTGVAELAPRAPALQESVTSVEIEMTIAGTAWAQLDLAVARALEAETIPLTTTRKGRTVVDDVRPALRRLEVIGDGPGGIVVAAEVATQPRGVRPNELVAALRELAGAPATEREDRVLRTHQWIERDGARREPLEADRAACAVTPVHATDKGLTNDRRDQAGGDDLREHHAESGERRIA